MTQAIVRRTTESGRGLTRPSFGDRSLRLLPQAGAIMPYPVRVVKEIFAKSEGVCPMQVVENRPSRTVLDELVERFLDAAAKSAAETARQRMGSRDIENSHKAVIERLRDENPDYGW